jgi:hypothetical protein
MLSTDAKIFIKEKVANLPVVNERPLELIIPKPSFARSHPRTAFGFQAMAPPPDTDHPQDIPMSDGVDDAMNEGADIANEGEVIDGGKLGVNHFFQCIHIFCQNLKITYKVFKMEAPVRPY